MKKNQQQRNKTTGAAPSKPTRKPISPWLYISGITLLFFLVFQYIFDEKLNLGGDNASYYILGKALADGAGFTNIQFPTPTPHSHFPPGYPLLLAIFMTIGVQSIVGLKWATGLFLLGAALFIFDILKRFGASAGFAFAVSVLMLFNFHLLYYSTIMMSEMPFLFFTLWSLWLLMRLEKKGGQWLKNPSFYLWILLVAFAFHIRTIGIALVFAYAAYLLLNKRWSYASGLLGGFVLLSLPWQLRNIHIGGSKYVNQLVMKNPYRPEEGTLAIGDWFERIFNNIYRYAASEIPSTFYPVLQIEYYEDPEPVHLLLGIPIILLCLIGLRAQKKFQQLLVSYLIASFGILWLWPDIWFGPRFMLPLYPILLFLALNGIKQIITTYTPLKNFSPYWFLLLILFIIPPVKGLNQFAKNSYLPEYERYFEAAKWVKKNTPKTAIVTTRKPDLFFLFAERPCINYPYDTNYTSFLDTLSARGVTHIVMEQLGYSSGIRYLYPAIVANQEKIRTVYQTPEPEAYVFAFDNTYGYRGEWRIDGDVNTSQKPVIGVKEGEGTYIFTDGSRYEGSWRSDARNGLGIMYYPDGSRFEGLWKNNRMEGPGKLFDSSGNLVKEGIWSDDELLP